MTCPKCMEVIPEDSVFCQFCGAHLEPQSSHASQTEEGTLSQASVINKPVHEEVSDVTPATFQPEVVPEKSLLMRAYNSYLSSDPEERRFFEEVLGSEELKVAYIEERQQNQRKYDEGIRTNYKKSYTDFMGALYDEYLGTPTIPPKPHETSAPKTEPLTPAPTIKKEEVPSSNKNHIFCKKCGAAIDPNAKKCSSCGKQYFRAKTTIPIVLLSVLLVASICLNVMQYLYGKEARETVATQTTKIEGLEKTVTSQKSTISTQRNTISSLEKKGEYFDELCEELRTGNIGYAASNFKASESVIIVDKNEKNRKFTLTANWSGGGTVSLDYSGIAAWVDFDNDSWTTSTKMTIDPWREGVTAVTFSNDVDSKTFKVIIIVT